VIPSTPSLPPSRAARSKELEIFESRALSILSVATMAGCCQVRFKSPFGNKRPLYAVLAIKATSVTQVLANLDCFKKILIS